jgi:fumarate hydratase class II
MTSTRIETDSLGEIEVPADVLYGASTRRAVLNFPISGRRFPRAFIRALGLIKWAAAEANLELGRMDELRTGLIARAAEEIISGKLDDHFPIDVFQTGSGTSTNMNANEVISNRCAQLAGNPLGSKDPVHPNDHANMSQSSNDVIPSTIHVAVACSIFNELMPALDRLESSLKRKTMEFWDVIKIGRTHLMDATPIRLGQEFSGYAKQIEHSRLRTGNAIAAIEELAIGGTAVGTGINCHPAFAGIVMRHLWNRTGITFREARNHFEAQSAVDGLVQASGEIRTIAVSLFKIANDIRWLASGPRCAIGELVLPETQPGSSIMPGKVNPVMSEMLMQVCSQVVGNDTVVTWAGARGNFELNTMLPLIAWNLLESIRLLTNAVETFRVKCIDGLLADKEQCSEFVEKSFALATSLVPSIGYDRAAEIARESVKSGKTIREICIEWNVLPEEELHAALDPASMTQPSIHRE